MKDKKYSIKELIFHACTNAEENILSLIDAWKNVDDKPEEYEEWQDLYKQIHSYRIKKYGKTHMESIMENSEEKTIAEIFEWHNSQKKI